MKKRLEVKVRAGDKKDIVVENEDGSFEIRTKIKPENGKANEAVIKLLAHHFKISPSQLRIRLGSKQKRKILEIND
jgi:uncharacterized protein